MPANLYSGDTFQPKDLLLCVSDFLLCACYRHAMRNRRHCAHISYRAPQEALLLWVKQGMSSEMHDGRNSGAEKWNGGRAGDSQDQIKIFHLGSAAGSFRFQPWMLIHLADFHLTAFSLNFSRFYNQNRRATRGWRKKWLLKNCPCRRRYYTRRTVAVAKEICVDGALAAVLSVLDDIFKLKVNKIKKWHWRLFTDYSRPK